MEKNISEFKRELKELFRKYELAGSISESYNLYDEIIKMELEYKKRGWEIK
ncbi:hypothetical protein K8R47_03360 [archaeon]|nr:hypothetical protein [archaeon]